MITVFTPIYNRGYIIHKLYESLCRQSFTDFEWIVVDDGSTDNTKALIQSFIAEEKINLRYFYQQNAGKHIAINRGVQEAHGDLFFIVDSDDYLTDDALEKMSFYYEQIKEDPRFVGVSGVRATPDGKRIGGELDFHVKDCNILDFGFKYEYTGDMSEAYKTSIMRKFPFPEIPDERFCGESLIWNRIAQVGVLRYTAEKWYIGEYREDGLTASITKVRMKSPKYAMLLYSEQSKYNIPLKHKIKSIINFWRFSFNSKISLSDKIKMIGSLGLIFWPLGFLMHVNDKKLLKKS